MKKIIKKILGEDIFYFLKKKFKGRVEELYIIRKYFAKNNIKGTMLDIGVEFGQSSEPFLDLGWKVYGFEPDKKKKDLILNKFKNNNNFKLFDFALSDQPGELNFYTSDESSGISSLLNFHPTHKLSDTVKVDTLNNVIEREKIDQINFIKIDVEGFDLMVLKGIDLHKYNSVDMIICEFEDRKTLKIGYTCSDMIDYLTSFGYQVLVCEWEPIVQYGGSQHKFRKASLFPCNIDPDSWGNIIAFKDPKFKDFALKQLN